MRLSSRLLACGVLGVGLLLGIGGCPSSTGGGGSGTGGSGTGGSADCGGEVCGPNQECAWCTSDDTTTEEYCENKAPAPGAGQFVCYNILCEIATEYCAQEEDELCAGRVTPRCKPLPAACSAGASCDCVLQGDPALTSCEFGGDATCEGTAAAGITVDTPCP